MDNIESTKAHWFSENPDRAWAEKFFLIYIPIWIMFMVIVNALYRDFGNTGDILQIPFSLAIALPYVLVPAILRRNENPNGHWYESYWFKANVYIFIVQFFGNYFISEYFFDVLGMIYNYPNLKINLDSALLGSGEQSVPLTMYPMTMATYMTYHTTAIIVMRRVMTSRVPLKWLVFIVLIAALAYFWSWMETQSFANAAVEGNFRYKDREAMLAYGSIVFGMSFIPSFPMFYFLDEDENSRWNLLKVCAAGLSAAMIGLFLTDLCTHVIGTL